jgi:uncharacterized protein (TIGR02246 family)
MSSCYACRFGILAALCIAGAGISSLASAQQQPQQQSPASATPGQAVAGVTAAQNDAAQNDAAQNDAAQNDAGQNDAGQPAEIPAEEKPFWDSAQAFVDAYARRDTAALGELFTENAEFLDEFGELTIGRQAIAEIFAAVFETEPDAAIDEIQINRVRYLSDSIAIEEGVVYASASPLGPQHQSRYVAIHSKEQDGKWRINTLKDFPREPAGRQEQLAQLAWLIGEWVSEDDESVIHSTCDWSPDGNFLIRDFTMQLQNGTELNGVQRIGWDAAMKKLRCWTFDAQGGYLHGLWTQDGNQWVLNLAGVTADGQSVTGSTVYTVIDPEMVTWNYRNLIVGDENRGDTEPVTMVKRPPAPAQAAN